MKSLHVHCDELQIEEAPTAIHLIYLMKSRFWRRLSKAFTCGPYPKAAISMISLDKSKVWLLLTMGASATILVIKITHAENPIVKKGKFGSDFKFDFADQEQNRSRKHGTERGVCQNVDEQHAPRSFVHRQ